MRSLGFSGKFGMFAGSFKGLHEVNMNFVGLMGSISSFVGRNAFLWGFESSI